MSWEDSGIRLFFFHKMDLQKVIDGGPWSFEQAMLIVNQVQGNKDPNTINLQEMEVWVQVYDLPRGCMSENILKSVGTSLGGGTSNQIQ